MARYLGFVGPTYSQRSVNIDAQRTRNWFPERNESGQGKSLYLMCESPGLSIFANLPGESSVSQMFAQNGRMFAAGQFFWEVSAAGVPSQLGTLNPAQAGPIFMASGAAQMLVCSSGKLYLIDLGTNDVTPVDMSQFAGPIDSIAYIDGFFLAMQRGSQLVYVSNLLNGLIWNSVNAIEVSEFTDNLVSMVASHRELWLSGSKQTVVYYNSGAALGPFVPISGAAIEQGSAALAGFVRADNSVFWVGQDELGAIIGWRAVGYNPQRVTNYAIENEWGKYPTVSDLVSWAYQENGHTFWMLHFPTANKTWAYDIGEQMWHERDYVDPMQGSIAYRAQCHCYAFSKHLVGDWNSGNIYQQSMDIGDYFGTPIERFRRAPHVSNEQKTLKHIRLKLDVESGLGTYNGALSPTYFVVTDANGTAWRVDVTEAGNLRAMFLQAYGVGGTHILNDPTGATSWKVSVDVNGNVTTTAQPLDATKPRQILMVSAGGTKNWVLQVTAFGMLQTTPGMFPDVKRGAAFFLRWSDDGGHSFKNWHQLDAGTLGNYKKRLVFRRLGSSRDRVYEVRYSDSAPARIVDAYIDTELEE